jgi:hypothetical protein
MTEPVRSPDAVPYQLITTLVDRWIDARTRTEVARYMREADMDMDDVDPEDLFTELVYGARIAQKVAEDQWWVVVDLLRSGAVDSWAQVGTAIGLTETEARDGFHGWISSEVALWRRNGTTGITDTEAEEFYALSESVIW